MNARCFILKGLWIGLLAVGLLSMKAVPLALAQSGQSQEEVLSGFGDKETAGEKKKQASGDDVLSGFGDDSGSSEKTQSGKESVLEGFQDSATSREDKAQVDATSQASPRLTRPLPWLDLGGSVALSSCLNLNHDGPAEGAPDYRWLSRLRGELKLDAEAKLSSSWQAKISGHAYYDLAYQIKGRDMFSDEALEELEREAELDEAWVQGKLLSNLDIKVGRQIVVWGKSDNLRVTDVLNPLDNREPGMVDIEDLRLPAAMTKLDLYLGDWNLSGIMVHEVRFNKVPPWGGDFYPVAFYPPDEETPDFALNHQEYGLALNGIFSGWDLSFYGASYYNEQRLDLTQAGYRRVHDRIWMAGAAVNIAWGSWLVKAEAAVVGGLNFTNLPGTDRTRLDLMAGLEYNGFSDTTISLEVVNRHLFDYEEILAADPDDTEENEIQSALRLTRTFLNDTLELSFLASTYGWFGDRGGFQRFQIEYDWTDNLIVTLGAVNYTEGDYYFFRNIGDKDRVYLTFTYHF